MPYVTEQLKFNLDSADIAANNRPVTRQPSPMLFDGIENRHDYNNNMMERVLLLARRDIRLGNFPKDDDLDHIPVKEDKSSAVSKQKHCSYTPDTTNLMINGSFTPGRCLVSHSPRKRQIESAANLSWKPKTSTQSVVNIPNVVSASDAVRNSSLNSISVMIDNLFHAYNDLNKPISKHGYPDVIEEERLQHRVEEQRRHLYRMLYSTKRHVSQLVMQLERTAFHHRRSLLTRNNVLCHMNTAYRSLMSGLNSFIRISHTLHSTYMTELKRNIRTEIKRLLEELKTVCNLLDIQIASLEFPVASPNVANSKVVNNPVSKLNITEKTKETGEAPLSPERNQSLKAALKSLMTAELSKSTKSPSPQPVAQQKPIGIMTKKMSLAKPAKKKVIKPKSAMSRYNGNYKKPISAGLRKDKRPLGKITNLSTRPTSAPHSVNTDPLKINGNLTPFITERELARQAWIDELLLERGRDSTSETSTPLKSIASPRIEAAREVKSAPIDTAISQTEFKSDNQMSTTMVELLDQLEEIEKEDEGIRSRWLHIQYSDVYSPEEASSVVLPSADLLEPVSNIIPVIHSSCSSTGPAVVCIPQQNIREIESYKEAMLQYLRLTKHFKTKGFDPWATINRIVDDIVDGVMGEVCNEIISSCDGLADNIYLSEFLPV